MGGFKVVRGGGRVPEVAVLGQGKTTLGPSGPLLRALGVGFALGMVATTLITLLTR